MNITNNYNISQGLTIISPVNSQQYTERLNSYSQLFTNLYTSNANNKFSIDSCWESGNIYYANYDEGFVKKISFDGTELATLTLANAYMVSVIQNATQMNVNVTYPPQDDQGCWIAEKSTNTVIKTDNELNIVATSPIIFNLKGIVANIDGGCYVATDTSLFKLSPNAIIEYTLAGFTNFKDIAIDATGLIWLCSNDKIYSLEWDGTDIIQRFYLEPLVPYDPSSFSSSSSSEHYPEEMHLGAIDVDRNTLLTEQFLYVMGGNSYSSFIIKYDNSGNLINEKEYSNISYPYIIKVIQGMGSENLYILEDTAKWDDFGYGSSSSSF